MQWMKANFLTNRRSIRFYKYFLSYIVVVVTLLAVISSIVYGNYIGVLRQEVENSSVSVLAQIRDTMDERINDMERIALQIGSDPYLTPFVASNYGYDSYRAVAEMKKFRASNRFISDIILIYNGSENHFVYTSNGAFTKESFFDAYRFRQRTAEQLHKILETIEVPVILPVQSIILNRVQDAQMSVYIVPLPMHSGKPYGVVMYLIDEAALKDAVANVHHHNDGYFYMLDGSGQPVFMMASDNIKSSKEALLEQLNLREMKNTVQDKQIDGAEYSIVKLSSNYNKWSFINVIPTEQVMYKVQSSRRLFHYTIAALLLLGLIMSFALADTNYRVLRRLVQITQDQDAATAEPGSGKRMDEIAFLDTTFRNVVSEKAGLMEKLQSRKGLVREQLLNSLLQGKAGAAAGWANPEDTELHLPYPLYMVLLFRLDEYNRFQSVHEPSMQQLLKFSIVNAVEELSMDLGVGYGLDLFNERGVALLLNLKSGSDSAEDAGKMAEEAKSFFKRHYKFSLTVGIGNIYDRIDDIHLSFQEARKALNYRFIKGSDQLIFYRDVTEAESGGDQLENYRYPAELEDRLAKAIKMGLGVQADEVIHDMTNFARSLSSPEEARYAAAGLINTTVKTLDELNLETDRRLNEELRQLLTQEEETIDALQAKLSEFCVRLCKDIAGMKESKNFELRDRILDHVAHIYADPGITLEGIAGQFQLSPSYITRFMKDQTGYSLIHYIDRLRMNRAKEMLRNGNQTIREILDNVGYVNETNFIRKFKKLEGITPMQYRSLWKDRNRP